MEKSSHILLLAVLIFTGCTRNKTESLLSKWEKKNLSESTLERKLASGSENQCLKDLFTTSTLKAEVKSLEKKYESAERVSGSWKHLNLSRLPVPQANFLKSFGGMIGDLKNPDNIDFSSCGDVPCLFNKIHGQGDSVHGYVHYLWYLKTGQLLAADNMVPGQASDTAGIYNGKPFELSDYLFDKNELYAFWRLSHMLKSPHTTLQRLKEIQRVPRGEMFEGERFKFACGLASSAGTILLNDGCLRVNDFDQGYFYHAVTHELTHHVDFEQGRGSRQFYRSHRDDYLAIAGMFINEFVDESGETKRQWQLRPGAMLMTGYAGTNPQENFAESISVFRVDGEQAKSNITSDHYNFVSKDYYEGRAFHREALIRQWVMKYSSEGNREIFKAVIDCSKQKSSPRSVYFKSSDFSSPVLPSMLNCIGNEAVEIGRSMRAKTFLHEPEGCVSRHALKFNEEWENQTKEFLKTGFDKHLRELQKDSEYLARIQNFYKEVSDPSIARNAFISCYKESDEEGCFNQKVVEGALEKASRLKLTEEQTDELAQMYVNYHSYESTKNQTKEHYRIFVSSHLESIREKANALWQGCESQNHNDDESPSGSLFQLGDGYMVSSFYNCLNGSISEVLQESVRNLSVDDFKVQHGKEEILLTEIVMPELIKILHENYESEKAKEKQRALSTIAEDKGELRNKIVSDFEWVSNIVDNGQILKDCKKEASKLLPFLPLYHLKAELFSDLFQTSVCRNISSSEEFNQWLNSSKEEFNVKIFNGIEDKVTELGEGEAKNCLKKYPIDSAISKLRFRKVREACLVDKWPSFEEEVLRQAAADPVVVKFQIPQEKLRERLTSSRRRLQLRVIKSHFN